MIRPRDASNRWVLDVSNVSHRKEKSHDLIRLKDAADAWV
jgi:hypothetical protein